MRRLVPIIKKNFKNLYRSRSSKFVLIFGPLLIMFLVGLVFSNQAQYDLNMGVYSSEYSEATESIISGFEESYFSIVKIESEELCVELIKEGKLHTCLIFSEDLNFEEEKDNEIMIYVDYSRLNLVYIIIDLLTTQVGLEEREISKSLTAILIENLDKAEKELSKYETEIAKIKEAEEQISSSNLIIKQKISSMNLSIDISSFQIDELKTTIDSIKSRTLNSSSEIKNYLNSINNSISLFINDETPNPTKSLLENIQNKNEDILNIVNQNRELNQKDIEDIESKLNLMSSALETLRLNMANMISAAQDITKESEKIKSLTEDINPRIDYMENSINSLLLDIESIQVTDPGRIVSPITTKIEPVSTDLTNLVSLFPILVVLIIMFISLLLSSTIVTNEKSSKAYPRNFATPTKKFVFILANYLTCLIVVFLQLLILFIISSLFFKVFNIYPLVMFGYTPLAIFLVTTLFISIGMTIGYIFKSQETSTLGAISVGSLLFLLSNIILPLESIPKLFADIVALSPFVVSISVFKKIIIFSRGFSSIYYELGLIMIFIAVFFSAIWFISKKN